MSPCEPCERLWRQTARSPPTFAEAVPSAQQRPFVDVHVGQGTQDEMHDLARAWLRTVARLEAIGAQPTGA